MVKIHIHVLEIDNVIFVFYNHSFDDQKCGFWQSEMQSLSISVFLVAPIVVMIA